jgi:hypothetical protein
MIVITVVSVFGLLVDQRELVGAPIWAKPLKFALSTLIYSVTWAWLIGQLGRFRKVAWWSGTIIAFALAVELALIVFDTVIGHRSHFNVSTPYDTAVWSVMAASIVVLWIMTFVVSVLLWFTKKADPARTLAVRFGSVLALAGLGLGFLMTQPTDSQLDDFQGIAGAHTVGADDGGTGLFLLGWSMTDGDLRIPHFVGMHALQAIPLVLLVIELASRRVTALRRPTTRVGLVWTVSISYALVLALVTWQALRGQSIVQPDGFTLLAAGGILLVVAAGVGLSLYRKDAVADPVTVATASDSLVDVRAGAGR